MEQKISYKKMKDLKKRKIGYNFNLRFGLEDVAVFEKEQGGFYLPVPLRVVMDISYLLNIPKTEIKPVGTGHGIRGRIAHLSTT